MPGLIAEGGGGGDVVYYDESFWLADEMRNESCRFISVVLGKQQFDFSLVGSSKAIEDAIRVAFDLGDSDFWLEDQFRIVAPIHCDMPAECYNLRFDTGDQRAISISFEGSTKRFNISGCPKVAEDVIRCVFGFKDDQRFSLKNESGVVYAIRRSMPLGTYTLHLLRAADRAISISFEGCTKRFNISGCPKVAEDVIRCVFGFKDDQRFSLKNESGVVYAICRSMPLGTYTLHLLRAADRAISISFEGCTKRFNISGCPKVAEDVIRCVFGFRDDQRFSLKNESGVVYAICRSMPLGTYTLHLLRAADRAISISFEGCTKRFNISGCPKVAEDVIRCVFGFRDDQRFSLKNESGVVHAICRSMPLGTYTLHLLRAERAISISFEGCTKRFDISGCPKVTEDLIRCVFGFEDDQRYSLKNESGVVYAICRSMPLGTYTLHLPRFTTPGGKGAAANPSF